MKNLLLSLMLATLVSPAFALNTQDIMVNSEITQNALEAGASYAEVSESIEKAVQKGKAQDSKAILICGRLSGGLAIISLQPALCEVIELKNGDFNTLIGLGIGLGLTGSIDSVALNPFSYTAGVRIGYVWGADYKNYLSLTKEEFGGAAVEGSIMFGGELGYMQAKRKQIKVGFAGVTAGHSLSIGQRTVTFTTPKKFYNSIKKALTE